MNGMRRGSGAAAACVLVLATAGSAQAADIQVTAGAGDGVAADGQCSLREAINSASDNGVGSAVGCVQGETALDVIHLPAGAYQLSAGGSDDTNAGGDLDAQGAVRITHDGAGVATIMGDGQDRVLDVQPAAAAELHGVTITGGRTLDGASSPSATGGEAEPGGGIRNRGSLALVDSTVSGNATGNGGDGATGGKAGDGGGVYSPGPLVLTRATITGNATGRGGNGNASDPGGDGGNAGDGGGIYANDLVTIAGSTIEDNTAGDGGAGGLGTNDRGGFGGRGGRGGGVLTSDDLEITDSVVRENAAGDGGSAGDGPSDADGGIGGIGGGLAVLEASSTATITRTTVADNRAGAGGTGSSGTGVNTVPGRGGKGGPGGGLLTSGATTHVTASRFTGNVAGSGGTGGDGVSGFDGGDGGDGGFAGGIYLQPASGADIDADIATTTVAGNAAGDGGPGGQSERGGEGGFGGVAGGVLGWGTGQLSVQRSTLADNHAGDGGASTAATTSAGPFGALGGGGGGFVITGGASARIENSTLSGNSAGDGADEPPTGPARGGGNGGAGGGIAADDSPVEVYHSTIASNRVGATGAGATPGDAGIGGGLLASDTTITLGNSIVASNPGGNCAGIKQRNTGSGGIFADGGHDIDFPASDCPGADADPKLGPLQDNGGPTFTRAIALDGAAVDAVPSTGAGCLATDQRGQARPQGPACDVGAFEAVPPAPSNPGGGDANPGGGNGTPSSPNDNPTGGGPAGGGQPVALATRLILRSQRLRTVLAKGFKAGFDSNEASTGVLEVFVEGSQARGLKTAAARKRVRVARGSRKLTAAGRGALTAKFTRRARRVLGKRKTATFLVRLTVTDASGAKSVKTRRVKLKR